MQPCTFTTPACPCRQPGPPRWHYLPPEEAGLGATQLWDTGISACFCKFFCTCSLPGCFHMSKSPSRGKVSWCNWIIPTVCCEGRSFPRPLFSPTAALSTREHPQSLHHPTVTTLSSLTSDGASALRHRRTLRNIGLPHQLHPWQPNPLAGEEQRPLHCSTHPHLMH